MEKMDKINKKSDKMIENNLKENFPTFLKIIDNTFKFLKDKNNKIGNFFNKIEHRFTSLNKIEKIGKIIIFLMCQFFIFILLKPLLIKFLTYECTRWRFYYGLFIFLSKKVVAISLIFSLIFSIYFFF